MSSCYRPRADASGTSNFALAGVLLIFPWIQHCRRYNIIQGRGHWDTPGNFISMNASCSCLRVLDPVTL